MQIYCRQCGAEIQAEDINLDKMIAKCDKCNAVFSFADMYEGQQGKPKTASKFDEISLPKNIIIQNDETSLVIERQWFDGSTIFVTVFAIFWNGILWAYFIPRIVGAANPMPLLMFLFFIVGGVGFGILSGYGALAGWLNTTTIRVDNHTLDIKHSPIPVLNGNKQIRATDIEQLYTKERVSHSQGATFVRHELHIIMYDGRQQALLRNLESEQALFIEQEIESFLKIENRPVRGEYR